MIHYQTVFSYQRHERLVHWLFKQSTELIGVKSVKINLGTGLKDTEMGPVFRMLLLAGLNSSTLIHLGTGLNDTEMGPAFRMLLLAGPNSSRQPE